MYEPAGSLLHAAFRSKQWYIAKYNDPIVQWTPETSAGHDSWMGLFLFLEAAFLLPAIVYGLYCFGIRRKGTSGGNELLFFVYALEVWFTTVVCTFDVWNLDSAVWSAAIKRTLVTQFYGPYLVLRKSNVRSRSACTLTEAAALGAVDMGSRILGRIRTADALLEAKKTN